MTAPAKKRFLCALKVLREPLVLFLVVAAVLYGLYHEVQKHADHDTIYVTKAALAEYLQYRQRRFDAASEGQLESMAPEARETLIADYIREEAMVRQARKFGLDLGDYIIRQRLIQKLEFIDRSSEADTPGEAVLRDWYDSHREKYHDAETLSFTHLFYAFTDKRTDNQVEAKTLQRAQARLAELNSQRASISPVTRPAEIPDSQKSDRFIYHKNYNRRGKDYISSHFGAGFAEAIFALAPAVESAPEWQGPLTSRYGVHLVKITGKTAARATPFAQVRGQVVHDYRQAMKLRRKQELRDRLSRQYRIIIE